MLSLVMEISFLNLILCALAVHALNERPIIGILSQEPSSTMIGGDEDKNYTSYVSASYVKFMESGGARVVPIMINQDRQYYADISTQVNGILFPGGANSIYNDSGYGLAGQYLYQEVLNRNAEGIPLPLWATCLGFEMLMYLSADYLDWRASCEASNIALSLIMYPGYETSRIFSQMPNSILNIFVTENVTANFHHFCFSPETFYANGLDQEFDILSTNFDLLNYEFISTLEHKSLPIFGTQWHPEKNPYEWKNISSLSSIPHFPDAIYSVQYFANFFVSQARQNDQHFPTEDEEDAALIYNYSPKYLGNTTSSFEQIYLFAN